MMICIGPAEAVRSKAGEVQSLLTEVLTTLKARKSKDIAQVSDKLLVAIERFEWIHKAVRGECGPPPREHPRRSTEAERNAKALAKILVADSDDERESSETLQ
jgi:hypothetical protein